ncbi:MAG: EAL domain-containing protein [Candidatus Marithrix sp.]|nr:EAL domain-containing protein [Candidatus Marithrix sp.]
MNSNSAHILVADDSALIRDILRQALQKYGYIVTLVKNGQQAIDYFIAKNPDLILMDADMPILDGISACTQIKKLPAAKHTPIIMITAFVESKKIDSAFAAGVTDYITKPVNLGVLRNRIHYILQAKQAEEALFAEKEKALITLASIGDGVITTDADGKIEFLNPVATRLTGWTNKQAQGLPLSQVLHLQDEKNDKLIKFPLHRCLDEGKTIVKLKNYCTILVHRDEQKKFAVNDSAAPIKDRNGNIIGVVLVFSDMTKSREMTNTLAYKASHDSLTGLYNRNEFKVHLENIIQNSEFEKQEHALLFMDLDNFKIVNDTCGHEAGDKLLKEVALLLQQIVIENKQLFSDFILARLGGDEFGLLLESCPTKSALILADDLCKGIKNIKFFWDTASHDKNIFTIGISIGLLPMHGQIIHPKNALAMADSACYAAKNIGRNNVYIYQKGKKEPTDKKIHWVSLINNSLEKHDGFSLFYQPIIPLQKHHNLTNCYEVLLRMNDPEGNNVIPPGAFLSAAVRYNLMPSLDQWVIKTLFKWLQNNPNHLNQLNFCTINISSYSLNEEFLNTLIKAIKLSEIPPQKLCFEFSETTSMSNFSEVFTFMTSLKKLGCLIALDNFGTGMASFNYLKRLPLDFLKIDGAWIKKLVGGKVDYAIIKSINEIAHLMQLQTIAECVESQEILNKLYEIEVDYAQGYWIKVPQSLKNIIILESRSL